MRDFFLFLNFFEAYLINKQIVFQNNIVEKINKKGDPNYVPKFKDSIKMSLIFTNFLNATRKCIVMWVII